SSRCTLRSPRGEKAWDAPCCHIIATARERGMSRLSLETGSWDYFQPARALYRSHGFAECPPFGDYVPDPNSIFHDPRPAKLPDSAESGKRARTVRRARVLHACPFGSWLHSPEHRGCLRRANGDRSR